MSPRHRLRSVSGEPTHEVLHHHDGRIHDEPEVQRAKAHEIRRQAETLHGEEGEQQRKRDHGGREERCTKIAEKEEEDRDDQQRALGEIREHRARRATDNITLAVEGPDPNAGWQDGLDLRDPGSDAVYDFPTI